MADLAQVQAHLLGTCLLLPGIRVWMSRAKTLRDLNVLRAEIAALEARVDREAKADQTAAGREQDFSVCI